MRKLLALGSLTALCALTGCAATASSSAKPAASATATPTATFSVRAATVKACDDILAFQKGHAQDTFSNDPASVQALLDAQDTPLEIHLQAWIDALNSGTVQVAVQAAEQVGADCGAIGIRLFPT